MEVAQLALEFPEWGGARKGAGRKRTSDRPRQRHVTRAQFAERHPLHVTLRLARGLPSLRDERTHRLLLLVLSCSAEKPGFRLIEHSAQSNHVHLVCEAESREHLARAVQGLCVSLARRLNRLWSRRGRVFDERYHVHVLRTPTEVRNALAYVLGNARKHGIHHLQGVDPCSSAAWFEDWHEGPPEELPRSSPASSPFPRPRTWLLTEGWHRAGPLVRDV